MTYTKYDLRKAVVSRAHTIGYMGDDDDQSIRALATDMELVEKCDGFEGVWQDLISEYKTELEHNKEWDI